MIAIKRMQSDLKLQENFLNNILFKLSKLSWKIIWNWIMELYGGGDLNKLINRSKNNNGTISSLLVPDELPFSTFRKFDIKV